MPAANATDPTPFESCVVVVDGDGDVVWASPEANRVLYRSASEPVEDATLHDVFGGALDDEGKPPATGGAKADAEADDATARQHRVTLTARDGVERSVNVLVEPLEGSAPLTAYACRRATDHLDRETVLARVADGVIALDADFRFAYLNDRATDVVDGAVDDLLGGELEDVCPAFATSDRYECLERALADQEPVTFDWHAESGETWYEIRAYPSSSGLTVYFSDVTDARTATEDRLERDRRERDRQFRAVFDGTLDALLLANDDGELVAVNDAACELFGVDEDALLGKTAADFTAGDFDFDAAWTRFLEDGEMTGEFPLLRPDGERRVLDFAATANVRIGEHLSALRDVTERVEAERRLEAQRDELDHLNRINALIRDVNRAIVGATDRRTIVQAVCDGLTTAEAYPLAVSFRVTRDEAIQVEYAAGPARESVSRFRTDDWHVVASTLDGVARSNELLALHDLQSDPTYPLALRETTTEHGLRSILFVPLSYDGVVYGVLGVATTHEDEFGDEERSVFEELGQILGTAIDAVQTKRLLHANAVAELEVEAVADTMPLSTLSALVGESWSLDGVVPLADHQYLLYVTGVGVDADVLDCAVADVPAVAGVRVVSREGEETTFEVRANEAVAVDALLSAGGRITGGSVEHGRTWFVVEVAPGTDVREYLSRVAQRDVAVSLRAKREVDDVSAADAEPPQTDRSLTERQCAVLEAAYRSGYFEWPRRRTSGEELADALDISSSTLHQHLRVALGKVLDDYYRTRSPPSD